jgi:DNA-binding transcriptional LysR family regulator
MIDSLPTFVAVATLGNFTKAAKAEGIAVSSVTRRIDLLEAELGAKLFARSSRHLVLTDAGESLLPHARRILAELEAAKQGLSDIGEEPRGLLTVTAPAMFGRLHIAPAVIGFLKLYPQLEVDLHLGDEIINLTERRVDVAIRIGPLQGSNLVSTQLAPVHRLVCASPDYLERSGRARPLAPLDLLEHNCLTFVSKPAPADWWSFAGVNRNLPLNIHGNFRSDDTGTLLQAAVAGVGIAHLASWLVSDMIASNKLISLFPHTPLKRPAAIHAVRMPGRSHALKSKLFVAHLRKAFGSPPYWDRA